MAGQGNTGTPPGTTSKVKAKAVNILVVVPSCSPPYPCPSSGGYMSIMLPARMVLGCLARISLRQIQSRRVADNTGTLDTTFSVQDFVLKLVLEFLRHQFHDKRLDCRSVFHHSLGQIYKGFHVCQAAFPQGLLRLALVGVSVSPSRYALRPPPTAASHAGILFQIRDLKTVGILAYFKTRNTLR